MTCGKMWKLHQSALCAKGQMCDENTKIIIFASDNYKSPQSRQIDPV